MRHADWHKALAEHGPFMRVVVAEVKGSAPREAGAEMRVWLDRIEGTIGGGELEFQAIARARALTGARLERIPLGPAMGQCCGGAVVLAYERISAASLNTTSGAVRVTNFGATQAVPLAVRRALARARDRGESAQIHLCGSWLVEPIEAAPVPLWIWGAGHVGRALVQVVEPLGKFAITWIDTDDARFPPESEGPTRLIAANPADLASLAPTEAGHLIVTYSHALDLELCHRLLHRGFTSCGLIGSASKWARFRTRLRALGHGDAQISRIACPIGDPGLGKLPQAIAIGVAGALLRDESAQTDRAGKAAERKGRAG